MRSLIFLFSVLFIHSARAQWTIQQSHTNVDLRSIHNAGGGVVWASGTQGTVLHTTDGGKTWQHCSIPLHAEKLDFQGIQAFDESTAVVMSSGTGDQSRIYKTTDGCLTWNLLFTNPDAPKGSFKAIQFMPGTGRDKGRIGDLIGDPVAGHFATFRTNDYGNSWSKSVGAWRTSAKRGEALIAASNSSLLEVRGGTLFVTGGALSRSRTLEEHVRHDPSITVTYVGGDIPLRHGVSAGAASIAARLGPDSVANSDAAKYIVRSVHAGDMLVAVGGDYSQPDLSDGTCAVSIHGSLQWRAAQTPPRGYRSSVAFDAGSNTWITVGPNGTDISTDDGRNWRPLKPSPGEPADADKHWNALSFPFAVGVDGRIGKLRENALKP